jgi:hypothetical protein
MEEFGKIGKNELGGSEGLAKSPDMGIDYEPEEELGFFPKGPCRFTFEFEFF